MKSTAKWRGLRHNNALQRTRVRPAGGRSPLSFETLGCTGARRVLRRWAAPRTNNSRPAPAVGTQNLLPIQGPAARIRMCLAGRALGIVASRQHGVAVA